MIKRKMVTLNPGQSKAVSFEVIPLEAKVHQVSVNGLVGSFVATEVPVAEFYMPSKITNISIWEHDILQWHYWQITYRLGITNRGGAPGTYRLEWQHDYDGNKFGGRRSATITLNPGETYNWSDDVDIDFTRCHQGRVRLWGDWAENNYSEGIVIEGVPQ